MLARWVGSALGFVGLVLNGQRIKAAHKGQQWRWRWPYAPPRTAVGRRLHNASSNPDRHQSETRLAQVSTSSFARSPSSVSVVSSMMKIKVVAPIRHGLEDQSCLPSQISFFHSCTMSVSLQFAGAQFPTVSFRLSSRKKEPSILR